MARPVAVIAIVVAIIAAIAVTQADDDDPGGDRRSGTARVCKSGGFAHLTRDDGTRFATEAECADYADAGGTVRSIPPTATVTSTPAPPSPTPTPRPLSAGCQTLNSVTYDGHLSVGLVAEAPFNRGERIVITTTYPVRVATPTSFSLRFAEERIEHPFPGTIEFVVPDDVTTDVSWSVPAGAVQWSVDCAT